MAGNSGIPRLYFSTVEYLVDYIFVDPILLPEA
jgi:hypothetical protein